MVTRQWIMGGDLYVLIMSAYLKTNQDEEHSDLPYNVQQCWQVSNNINKSISDNPKNNRFYIA